MLETLDAKFLVWCFLIVGHVKSGGPASFLQFLHSTTLA
jgi:hypothetical protein